jgi:hypothetical protein
MDVKVEPNLNFSWAESAKNNSNLKNLPILQGSPKERLAFVKNIMFPSVFRDEYLSDNCKCMWFCNFP